MSNPTRTLLEHERWIASGAEAPLEPDLPIVDAHLHSWHRGDQRYFVEEFAQDLAACGHQVIATVATDCGAFHRSGGPAHLKSVGETEFMVGMSAIAASGKYTDCRVAASIVANADLTLGEQTRELLEAHRLAANGRLVGVRHTAKWDEDPVIRGAIGPGRAGLYLEPAFHEGFKLLAQMGLVFDASIYHPQLPDVIALARAHPEVSIVVIHSASPLGFGRFAGRDREVHAAWLAHMRELAQCPNAYIKLGGLLMCLRNFDYAAANEPISSERLAQLWRPFIEPCLELFGARRCLVAGNYPVDRAGLPYGTIWNMFKRITQGCSDEEKRWIYSDAAKQLYRIQ